MAEIKIEKKSATWPWIVAAILIILLLLYFFVWRDDGATDAAEGAAVTTEQTVEDNTTRTAPPAREDDPVSAYVQFTDENREMGLDHEYTNNALRQLTDAVEAKANDLNFDIRADLDQVREHAKEIQQDPFETTHANKIRAAAEKLAQAMNRMQEAHFPNVSDKADEVEKAAQNIDPNTLTLDQRDAVKSFFDESAELLREMN